MKENLENLEEALSPTLWSRIGVKVWYLVILVLVFGAGTKLAYNAFYPPMPPPPPPPPPAPVVIDHAWFIRSHQDIQALEQEIEAARDALERHQKEVKERSGIFSISRKEDRAESERLNHNILELQRRRIDQIQSYNLQAAKADAEALGELPKELSLEEKKGILQRVLGN